jgi:hypothetical protein
MLDEAGSYVVLPLCMSMWHLRAQFLLTSKFMMLCCTASVAVAVTVAVAVPVWTCAVSLYGATSSLSQPQFRRDLLYTVAYILYRG